MSRCSSCLLCRTVRQVEGHSSEGEILRGRWPPREQALSWGTASLQTRAACVGTWGEGQPPPFLFRQPPCHSQGPRGEEVRGLPGVSCVLSQGCGHSARLPCGCLGGRAFLLALAELLGFSPWVLQLTCGRRRAGQDWEGWGRTWWAACAAWTLSHPHRNTGGPSR